ncbi:MAG: phosphoribosylamine--glycine ligase [Robiginitomaculum sp.]
MKILLIGSGGREHSLAWKIIQSPLCDQLICAPGNAGICEIADCVNIKPNNIAGLLAFIKTELVDFVVVGPEMPLALGLVDTLAKVGVPAFGPTQAAAMLETSKAFTKDFCIRHQIPTAPYDVFTNAKEAIIYLDEMQPPYVIKADGLAAGKGVIITEDKTEAITELKAFFSGKLGPAGECVVIEEFMRGHEISFFALTDGKTVYPLCEAQDHKRAYDGDKGPNTGGMGAYSPVPGFTQRQRIIDEILIPTVQGMARAGTPFAGVLFAGLMMTKTGPKLIEYNVRFGDPECQVLMRRLKGDILALMIACQNGTLDNFPNALWREETCVNVVLAAKGYPGDYGKGLPIQGVDAANQMDGVLVFHAGTKRDDKGKLLSDGGRVLNITASGKNAKQATARAYAAIDEVIKWPGGFCRRDIAKQALALRIREGHI